MPRPSIAQLQQQVQQQMEAEGIVETSKLEKIVLEDGTAIKHKLDQTAAEVRELHMTQARAFYGQSSQPLL